MRAFMRVITIVYMTIFTGLGAWLAAFALHLVPVDTVAIFFQTIYDDQQLRAVCGVVGAGIILFNLMVFQLAWARLQRQRTIAFTNPDGQVTISLGAIEEFIRRTARQVSEIRDLKSDVLASKKGIEIQARISLWAGAHIPEVTEKIQGLIKSKVQDMLGIEDPVWVRVHIAKIVAREEEPSAAAARPRGEPADAGPGYDDPAAGWPPRGPQVRGIEYGAKE